MEAGRVDEDHLHISGLVWRTPRMRWRVVLGRADVIDTLVPTIRLTSVDLPTLGRPTTATKPERTAQPPLREASPRWSVRRRAGLGGLGGGGLDADPVDAPAAHVHRGQAEAVDLDRLPGAGHPAQRGRA